MQAKVLTFINMKGGVGKTTLCIGIGEYLANYRNKKILFIDLDPQFNTTQSLMNYFDKEDSYMDEYLPKNKTVKRILESITRIGENYQAPKSEDVIVELSANMHIIPGTIHLILEDTSKDGQKTRKLRRFIAENNLREKYDFIFIDCPPTISIYTDSALLASDFYLVPNRIDRYSILGIKYLKQVIDQIKYNEELNIKPLGIVYTMVDKVLTKKSQDIISLLEGSEIVQEIGIFETKTTFNRDLAVGVQGNISSKYKNSKETIEILADEFLRKVEEKSND